MKQLLNGVFGNSIFQFFKNGCTLKNINNSSIELRNSTDTGYANISVAEPISNSHCATKLYVDDHAGADLTENEIAAIQAANNPTGENPMATIADIGGGTDISAGLVVPVSQASVTYSASFDSITAAMYNPYKPIVDYSAGEHSISLPTAKSTKLTIRGDTRPLAGISYIHGQIIRSSQTGSGAGTVSLTSGGTDIITINASSITPNLSAFGVGDKCITNDSSGNTILHTISEVIANNRFRLSPSAPMTMDTLNGCSITFLPNRKITNMLSFSYIDPAEIVDFIGFWITGGISLYGNSHIRLQNCVVDNIATVSDNLAGVILYDQSRVDFLATENSVTRCYTGIQGYAGTLISGAPTLVNCPNFGFRTFGGIITFNLMACAKCKNRIYGGRLDLNNSFFAGNWGSATLVEVSDSGSSLIRNSSFNSSYYGLTGTYGGTVRQTGNTFYACNYNTATNSGYVHSGY